MKGVEKYVQYSATVDTVTQAWEMLMTHLDEFPEPALTVRAKRSPADTEEETTVTYEVSIGGLVT